MRRKPDEEGSEAQRRDAAAHEPEAASTGHASSPKLPSFGPEGSESDTEAFRSVVDVNDDLLLDNPAILHAFRRGEREAMTAVYDAYLPFVERCCRHGVGAFRGFYRQSDADDAIQSVFCAAFGEQARLGYDGLRPYTQYLRGVARNVLIRMLDKRSRFERPTPSPDAPEASAEDTVAGQQTRELIARFRAELDETDRAILDRYFTAGAPEEGLANELGITRYRLRRRIAKLHKRMRWYLKDHGLLRP